jgi:hypothetical protein
MKQLDTIRANWLTLMNHSMISVCNGLILAGQHRETQVNDAHPKAVFSSADGITIPHLPGAAVMPPIDLDPLLQAEFRQLLNPCFTTRGVRPYGPAIAALAGPGGEAGQPQHGHRGEVPRRRLRRRRDYLCRGNRGGTAADLAGFQPSPAGRPSS